jgi:hypothetical protein
VKSPWKSARRGPRPAARLRAVMLAVALALAAGTAAAAPASAHASPAAAGGNAGSFWITMTPGETFAQAAAIAARKSPGRVDAALRGMLRSEEAGRIVRIPQGRGGRVVNAPASRADLAGALAAAEGASPESTPSGWPVRGNACGDNRAWCNLVLQIAADECDGNTCTLEDELTARLTVNPSVSGANRVNWNVLYSPDHGDFAGYHFEWYVLEFASETQCGTGNTDSYSTSTSGNFTTNCNTMLYDSRNTTAVQYWAYLSPAAQYQSDQAKDGTAICQTESSGNNYCLY